MIKRVGIAATGALLGATMIVSGAAVAKTHSAAGQAARCTVFRQTAATLQAEYDAAFAADPTSADTALLGVLLDRADAKVIANHC
jgi:hypothetical protein